MEDPLVIRERQGYPEVTMDNSEQTPEEVVADYKARAVQKNKNLLKVFLIGIPILIVLFLFGSNSNNESNSNTSSSSTTESTTTPTFDDTWVPAGFTGYAEDDNVAWRWGTKNESNCTYSSGSCWSVVLITRDGCPSSLYGEVNIFDKNSIQISYTNDTLGTVQPMQKVKLTFDTFDDSAQSANISKFSCYQEVT